MGKGLLDASSRVESIRDTCIVEEEAHHKVVTFAGMRTMIIRKDGGGEKGFLMHLPGLNGASQRDRGAFDLPSSAMLLRCSSSSVNRKLRSPAEAFFVHFR